MNVTRRAAFKATPMSRIDCERRAEDLLTKLAPKALLVPTKIDVVECLESLEAFGVGFGVQDLPPDEEGFTDPERHEIVISTPVYLAALERRGRARQTCAHEIGHLHHIVQARAVIRHSTAPELARRINVDVPIYCHPEWQAERIGSALLMPRTTFPAVYAKGGVTAASEVFGVTRRNAEVRADVLGLTQTQ